MTHNDDTNSQNSTIWLTRKELAERLRVKPSRLAYWAVAGIGPRFTKFAGGEARYRVEDVTAWEAKLAFKEEDAA